MRRYEHGQHGVREGRAKSGVPLKLMQQLRQVAMSAPKNNREYVSSVTLMVLGDDLDPQSVSKSLRLSPTQSWRRGELRAKEREALYGWGGWKKALPEAQKLQPLSRQLTFWVRALRGRTQAIAKLTRSGHLCALNCYIGSSGTASIIVSAKLQQALAAMGLELRLSFFASENGKK